MKSIFILAAVGLVAAQNLEGEPACATPCLKSAISSVCTPASDQGCACASQAAIGNFAVSCLLANCDQAGLLQAQTAAASLCSVYSATAGSGTASSTAAPSTTPTGAGNSTASTTATITSSASLSSATGSASSSSKSSSSTGSSTGSAASASSSAGAAVVQGSTAFGAGLIGMLLAGLAAL